MRARCIVDVVPGSFAGGEAVALGDGNGAIAELNGAKRASDKAIWIATTLTRTKKASAPKATLEKVAFLALGADWRSPGGAAKRARSVAVAAAASPSGGSTGIHVLPFQRQLPSREKAETHRWLSQYSLPSAES